MYFCHSFPQVWQWVVLHTVPYVLLLLLVDFLPLMSSLVVSLYPCVKAGSNGPKLYGRILICVVSWPLEGFLAFPGGFSLALHILLHWNIRWTLSTLSHPAVLSLTLLRQMRGVVLGVVPPLCVSPSSLPRSLQGILLVNRRQLTLTRHGIIIYLLVAPGCTYLRPVLVLFILGVSHNSQMPPKYLRSIILVTLLLDFLGRRYSQIVVTELIYACWFLSLSALLSLLLMGGDIWCETSHLLLIFICFPGLPLTCTVVADRPLHYRLCVVRCFMWF